MAENGEFSKAAAAKLDYYVYALVDPDDNSIFYVGKAGGNLRPFKHLKNENESNSAKQKRIAKIRAAGKEPRVDVLRYGLKTEESCFDVEAAIIDALGIENLTNDVRGHGVERGRQTAEEVNRLLEAPSVAIESIKETLILFFITRTYSPTKGEIELYDATRQFWHQISDDSREPLADGRPKYRTAAAVSDSVVVRVYSIEHWFEAGTTQSTREFDPELKDRWEFVGRSIDHPLLGKRLTERTGPLAANQKGYRHIPPK